MENNENSPTLKELKEKWNVGNVEGGLRITGYKGSDTSEIIPETTSEGKKIVAFGFSKGKDFLPLEELVIEAKVEEIGEKVFLQCTSLRTVVLPDTVKKIGAAAFSDCTNLEKINLPDGLITIETGGFSRCKALKEIEIPHSMEELASGFHHGVFNGCSSLKNVALPPKLKEIADSSFSGCSELEQVTYSENVKRIGYGAFEGCGKLEKFDVTKEIEVGSAAFRGCNKFADENGFIIVNDVLYGYIAEDKEVTIPDGVKMISHNVFEGKGIEKITLPEGLTEIQQYAFATNRHMKEIQLPSSLTTIGMRSFVSCLALEEVIGLEGVNCSKDAFENTPFGKNDKK